MDIKSGIKTDRLYWLGRYLERVYTTILNYEKSYDIMIEQEEEYKRYCKAFDIPDIYGSAEKFLRAYPFDIKNPDSIRSNLGRAYDNAVELREEIGSESLSYIQLAIYEMNKGAVSKAPMMEFQRITDNILAFWGCIDDMIEDHNTRNLLKVGKRVERIDLLGRLHADKQDIVREIHRLSGRIQRCILHYNQDVIVSLNRMAEEEEMDYEKIVQEVDSILEV